MFVCVKPYRLTMTSRPSATSLVYYFTDMKSNKCYSLSRFKHSPVLGAGLITWGRVAPN